MLSQAIERELRLLRFIGHQYSTKETYKRGVEVEKHTLKVSPNQFKT